MWPASPLAAFGAATADGTEQWCRILASGEFLVQREAFCAESGAIKGLMGHIDWLRFVVALANAGRIVILALVPT
jgi:hypothetical protein